MLYPDLVDLSVDVFGGYCPAIPPQDLPPGASPFCQDVVFSQGGVRTRGGLLNLGYAALNPAASVNGLKSFITSTLAQRLLVWDSLSNFYKETPQGILDLIASRPYPNLLYESTTLFGREYQAFFNSLGGFDIPRQFDDIHWDRVSQCGPGAPPVVQNYLPPAATIGSGSPPSPATITTITRTGREFFGGLFLWSGVSVQTATAHGLNVGDLVAIAGVTDATFDGTFKVTLVTGPDNFNYAQTFSSSSGTTPTSSGGTSTKVVTSIIRLNGIVTVTTSGAHGFSVGWTVLIGGIPNIAHGGAATATQVAGVVTISTATAHGFVSGQTIVISGASDASFNGTFTVQTVPSTTTFTFALVTATGSATGATASSTFDGYAQILSIPTAGSFTFAQIGQNESSTSAGTATIVGNISAGRHNVSVAFVTRQGFIAQPSPPAPFYAAGAQLAAVSDIATGPPNVVARLILFTPAIIPPATQGTFYSIPTMMINDNVSTTVTVDFSDEILIASFQAEYLFNQLELGECAFSAGYNARLIWLGERNKQPNFVNLTFDGGFMQDNNGNLFPLGWTEDPSFYAGGESASGLGLPADWGDAYAITGNGSFICGKMTQSAFEDYLGVAIIASNTSYSVRARVRSSGRLVAGTLHINLQSTIGGFTTAGLAVAAAQVGANYAEFTATLTNAPLATPPSDLQLQVYADGIPTTGGTFLVDSIEIFPTNSPFNYSIARISHAFNPESYDSITGQVQIRPNDGQQLRAGFPLRNNYYLAKDHYLCYVTDDGVNEPASWAVNEVSATVGICGPNAVDWTEEWAVFAERSGLYVTWGGDPVKITPEIQEDASLTGKIVWNSINWAAGYTIWVRIDKVNKRILVGAPVNGATAPNVVFVVDYKWLDSAQDIASTPMVVYSAFTGKILAHGRGRHWTYWNIAANSMTFAERSDGTAQPFFGNGAGNGKIYQQIEAPNQLSDDGVEINSIYTTYFCPGTMEEQQLQLGAHRKLLGYLKWRTIGAGGLLLSVLKANRVINLRNYTLSTFPTGDGERCVNLHGERFAVQLATDSLGSWFQLERFVFCMKKDATIPVRGMSA